MAARKNKPVFGSKSAFVRGIPADLPAKEVVAQAASQGMKLSIAQVYNIRSTTRKKRVRLPSGTKLLKASQPDRSTIARTAARVKPDMAHQLRQLVAEVGLVRARAVLSEMTQAVAG